MTTNDSQDVLRSRRRLAEERLLESSSWRDDLDDVQAQRLMNWARDHINHIIEQTAVLSDEEVEGVLEEALTAVMHVMATVNSLTATLPQLDEAAARKKLQKFSIELQPIPLPPIPVAKIDNIVTQTRTSDSQTTFDTLFQLLVWHTEDEPEINIHEEEE